MTFSIAPIQRWIWRDSERRVQKLLRFAAHNRIARGEGRPETFTFLGFTRYCEQGHKSGTFTVLRITAKKRMVAKLKAIKAELQRRMHDRMARSGACQQL
jgi:RNA-directed DNA polymerase